MTQQVSTTNGNDHQEVLADFIVTTTNDENDGDFSTGDLSLREAIALANDGNIITFDSDLSGSTINLTLGELLIDKNLTINNLTSENLVIDANKNSRLFNVDDGKVATELTVTFKGLTLANGGNVANGGGILNYENLTINNSLLTTNGVGLGGGGAIRNAGTLKINSSTIDNSNGSLGNAGAILNDSGTVEIDSSIISNNSSGVKQNNPAIVNDSGILNISNSTINNNTGGINNSGIAEIINSTINDNVSGGGVNNNGTVTIINSTIANNGFSGNGGGIRNNGTATISNSTIVDNFASSAGGIQNSGRITLNSSIVANNSGRDVSGEGEFISGGNNLIGNGEGISSSFNSSPGDLVGTADNPLDPQLGELQNNGGLTETIALLSSSPAIDAGSNPNNLETDQRGKGFSRTVGNGTDIGAYEVQDSDGNETPTEFVVSTLEDENDGDFSAGDLSLREAIALANEQEGADTIAFDDSLSGGTIALNSSQKRELLIDDSLYIAGLGQDNLTLDGGFVLNIAEADTNVTIEGLNFTGGTIDNSGNLTFSKSTISETQNIAGSSDYYAIITRGNANIIDSTIKDNSGGSNVGIVIESGTATIERSAITGNDSTAYAQSGIIIRPDTTVNISNSTIANNQARSTAGIENAGGTVNITNSTIANNRGGLSSGGINNFLADGVVTITSSIIANNTGGRNIGDISGDGKFISGGNNLISNGDDATGFINGVNSDLVGTNGDDPENPQLDGLIDARLGELQDNGGSTATIALLEGSPAIDVGSNPNNLATDQRGEGFKRTVGNGTDIGAYEVQDSDNDADPIKGTSGDDLLLGTVDDDLIEGLDGSDTLLGNTGDDNLSATGDRNILLGNEGNDTLFGLGGGNDSLVGGEGDDVIFTESGNSTLIGGEGDDSLSSNGGNNIIQGNGGDDILISSAGGNILLGGAGSDRFNLFISDTADRDIDIISDFHPGEDRILLTTDSGMGNATYDSATGALFLDDLQVASLATGLDIHPDDLM